MRKSGHIRADFSRLMPTLDWIGKQAVVRHHAEVPFHLLKEEPQLTFPIGENLSEDHAGTDIHPTSSPAA